MSTHVRIIPPLSPGEHNLIVLALVHLLPVVQTWQDPREDAHTTTVIEKVLKADYRMVST